MYRSIMTVVLSLMLLCSAMFAFAEPQSEAEPDAATASSHGEVLFDYQAEVEYSNVFDVEYHGNYKLVTVSEPWPGAQSGFTYLLVQRGTDVPDGIVADRVIEVPVRSIVSMSTSYLPHLETLDLVDTLIAVDALAWISSEAVLERVEAGGVKEVGSGPTVNVELLLDLEPELIMTYGQGGEYDTHPKLEEANLPYVINAEWNEKDPLARAEWVKFMALFFNKERRAAEVFSDIESEYRELTGLAASASEKPTVFIGAPYQGTWWVSGGASFAARLLADAGAEYIWADDDSTGSLMLDIETVYEKAGSADFWLNTGYWNTLADAKAADERFTKFAAYKNGDVYNNNRRMGPGGGNLYYESGPANPDVILADLIAIFHPELLPEHELYYYKKLD